MFDGQAANLNRSSGAIVMRQFEQKRNKEELAKKQQKWVSDSLIYNRKYIMNA